METVIVSRQMFADSTYLPLFDKDMIISIEEPGGAHARPSVFGVRRLDIQFADVTEELMDGQNRLWRPLDKSHVEIIVDFVQSNLPKSDRLIIHCAAGVSRSPGVGIGLARYFDIGISENELRDRYPRFNIVVAQKIWEVCRERNYFPLLPPEKEQLDEC